MVIIFPEKNPQQRAHSVESVLGWAAESIYLFEHRDNHVKGETELDDLEADVQVVGLYKSLVPSTWDEQYERTHQKIIGPASAVDA